MKRYATIAAFLIALFVSEAAQAQVLSTTGSCPGVMTFDVTGATPFSRVVYLRAFGTGSYVVPPGYPCAGTVTGLDNSIAFAAAANTNALGECTISAWVPAWACGTVYVQVIDLTPCTTSNVILIT